MNLRMGLLAGAAVLALGTAAANAATVSISGITATWQNVVGGGGGSVISTPGLGGATTSVRWPAAGAQSGYNFTIAGDPINVNLPPDPSPFTLGTFNHLNFPIVAGSGIDSVQLAITANISVDGNAVGNKMFVFDFDHWETPNGENPCANGGANNVGVNINGCADRVAFASSDLSESFEVDGVLYTLTLSGFQVGGSLISEFWTIENSNNIATLVGQVSRVEVPVPAPAAMALFGMGLLGLGFAMRRRPEA